MVYPWVSKEYLVHKIIPRGSAIPTSLALVKLTVLSFCLLEKLRLDPFPIDSIAPV